MSNFRKFFAHLRTIGKHRRAVRKWCFKMGLYIQGLLHDLSKYSPAEFSIYKFYQGDRSPHEGMRSVCGYSSSWMHHYHKNKHHWEYYLDNNGTKDFIPVKMPYKYVIEMFCDRIGACMVYEGEKFSNKSPLRYYRKFRKVIILHEDSRALLEILLDKFAVTDQKAFVKWYRQNKRWIKEDYNNGTLNYIRSQTD